MKSMRSGILPRRRAAAIAIAKLAGKDFGYDPAKTPEEAGDAIKAAELWWLRQPKLPKKIPRK